MLRKSKTYSPNGGLMMIYHGRIRKKSQTKQIQIETKHIRHPQQQDETRWTLFAQKTSAQNS